MTDALDRLAERLPEVKEYQSLEWVPPAEMGFDPGGREVRALADAALAACANKFAAVVILIDEYEQENARLKTELEATEGAFELRKQIDSDLVWELRRRAEQAEAELAALRKDLDHMTDRRKRAQRHGEKLKAEVAELKAALSSIAAGTWNRDRARDISPNEYARQALATWGGGV